MALKARTVSTLPATRRWCHQIQVHGYVPNTSRKVGMTKKTRSCHADCPAVIAMQARKWPICFQGRYVKSMGASQYAQLTILAVEPIPYMAKALAESGDRRKELGLPISEEAILQMKSNLVRLSRTICISYRQLILIYLTHSISMKNNSRLQPRKRKRGDTM